MIFTDFDYYCQDCPRLCPKAQIVEMTNADMSAPPEEAIVTEITITCTHRKECARLMRALDKRYKREQQQLSSIRQKENNKNGKK